MAAVLNGTLDEATVLAQYPYYDLDGDGHITKFDLELAVDALLGVIPNGVISSATTQLYPSKVYGSISSIYDMAQGIGFVAGPFGVYGTGLIGKSLRLVSDLAGTSSRSTANFNSYCVNINNNPNTSVSGYGFIYNDTDGYCKLDSKSLQFWKHNNTSIVIQPVVVSTW
jgi:hypothetical protein